MHPLSHAAAIFHWEDPEPTGPWGAKGIGESGSVGAPPAVVNAAVDALGHLGVRHIDMPVTPRKLFALLDGGGS